MLTSQKSIATPLAVAMLFCASLLFPDAAQRARAQGGSTTAAATDDKARGIEHYRKGYFDGAIEALSAAVKKDKTDAEAWHILGLAYYNSGDGKNARKAFEMETRLRPGSAAAHIGLGYALLLDHKFSAAASAAEHALLLDAQNADAHYIIGVNHFREGAPAKALAEAEQAIKLKPGIAPAYLLKIQVLLGTSEWALVYLPDESETERLARFKAARENLEAYRKLFPTLPGRELLQETLENLDSFLKFRSDDADAEPDAGRTVFSPKDVDRKARVLSNVKPGLTDAASKKGVTGTVVIRGIIARDGTLKNLRIIKPLPYGLTEEAIRAARGIQFQPAMKDNRVVAQYFQIEYEF